MSWKSGILFGFLAGVLISSLLWAWAPSHETPTLKEKTETAVADSVRISEWLTRTLTELYVRFDRELEAGRVGKSDMIRSFNFCICVTFLERMMSEYESAVGSYEGASGVVWPIKVCAEAEAQFWPRITRLETFDVSMMEPDPLLDSRFRLYRRYGALVNHGHEAAYHLLAGSE